MKTSHRLITLFLLITAAIGCYIFGSNNGMYSFIVIGALFELAFWFGLFSDSTKSENTKA